ncbi:hypothetical protein BM1_10841 [Bipolaris maydis]|nr:hypothetical protein BM1_10841 [Bipolaris maydis]
MYTSSGANQSRTKKCNYPELKTHFQTSKIRRNEILDSERYVVELPGLSKAGCRPPGPDLCPDISCQEYYGGTAIDSPAGENFNSYLYKSKASNTLLIGLLGT